MIPKMSHSSFNRLINGHKSLHVLIGVGCRPMTHMTPNKGVPQMKAEEEIPIDL